MEHLIAPEKLDFSNTEIAFSDKSNRELKKMKWLFKLMNKEKLVKITSSLGLFAVKYSLPFAKTIVKSTIFNQFCGGEGLLDSQSNIDRLHKSHILTILDYGAEGKSGEEELEKVAQEFLKGLEFAASNESVPVVVVKLTAIGENKILSKRSEKAEFNDAEKRTYHQLKDRLHRICKKAKSLGVGIFIDAEESWMQDAIDELADEMMEMYNKERVVVYNTFQLYRHDRLEFLYKSHQKAQQGNYLIGAKLVRGAYMDKERKRAIEMGYPSPIQPNKEATDRDYNLALKYCLDHYETISSCAATHNAKSCFLQAEHIEQKKMPNDHPHLNFCQLYGMSDNITYNLAASGYNASKYLVYGKVKEVLPYLIRRAEENSSVTGDIGRELKYIEEEVKRRGL
ncbi:proline dehydrogenase family protein [Portibacter lacus]|uniref:Proline dehydrogenase n=1 Tax=Portibacter lacus TaxID=1099794 RepID=A0AA37WG32_9BACT|nr:proline dehydrogenase family protein [Portibacter lacus]GLR19393.1 proline dehydrogenase [Portibacter lacus]